MRAATPCYTPARGRATDRHFVPRPRLDMFFVCESHRDMCKTNLLRSDFRLVPSLLSVDAGNGLVEYEQSTVSAAAGI